MRARRDGIDRRQFLTRAGLGGTLLAAGAATRRSAAAATAADGDADRRALRALFSAPPDAGKPMTRWWWFGGAVTPEEVTRELTFMKQAGLRGAEIQPVYPLEVDDPARGIRNLNYFSDEFLAVVRHAVREARRLELQLDFTLGSGWPYGGPFIPTSLAARRLRVLSQDVVGPQDYAWDLTPHLTGDDRVVRVVATPIRPDAVLDVVALAGARRSAEAGGLAGRAARVLRPHADRGWNLAALGIPRLAHRPARQAPDDRHGRPGARPPQPRGDGALPARRRRPRDERPGRGGAASLPLGLLRQPGGLRRRLDEGLRGRVRKASRLRPVALPARAVPRRGRADAARSPRRAPDAVGAEPRLLLRSAGGLGRERAG